MQNRYVGDFGDYVKLAIRSRLSEDFRLGVAWYLYQDERHNSDGRHVDYLKSPDRWRSFAPTLFDHLGVVVSNGERHVAALERWWPTAIFARQVMPILMRATERRSARQAWFRGVQETLVGADLIFADPDNGLEPDRFSFGAAKSGKSTTLLELRVLAESGRCVVLYHHQTRRKGGHFEEILFLINRLRDAGFASVDALRAGNYSPRLFLILNASSEVRDRAKQLSANRFIDIGWHPGVHK
ncbi:MAG TPA: hypothetical protein VII56_15670 [Rhizomicrobium sp.]